jgi:hypothetical protein
MSKLFDFIPHPRIEQRKKEGPAKVQDQLPATNGATRFNSWLAMKITGAVGTMWCAYAFFALALISLPDAIKAGTAPLIQWIAQTFLQLVLLSIIIVGQNIQSAAADKRSEATYEDADAVLHTALQIQQHLEAQDHAIERILEHLAGGAPAAPAA